MSIPRQVEALFVEGIHRGKVHEDSISAWQDIWFFGSLAYFGALLCREATLSYLAPQRHRRHFQARCAITREGKNEGTIRGVAPCPRRMTAP